MSRMRIWLFQGGQRYEPDLSPHQVFEDLVKEAKLAERVGFHGIFAAEHHFTNYASITNPIVYASALSQVVTRIRLGTMGVVLPLHHPLRVAEDAAMVDQLSNGRFELGLARGYAPYEYGGLGASMDDSATRMSEGIDVITQYWNTSDEGHRGTHWDLPARTISPKPRQHGGPPMWYACGSEASIDIALQRNMSVIKAIGVKGIDHASDFADAYHARCRALGIDPVERRFAANVFARFGDAPEEIARSLEQSRHHIKVSALLGTDTQQVRDSVIDVSYPVPGAVVPDEQILSGTLIGSENDMRRVVEGYAELGYTDMSLNLDIGDVASAERMDTIRAVSRALSLNADVMAMP